MNSNKKILIKKFLSLHYSNLEYSPKRMMYYKEGNVYFEYQPKDEIIFLNFKPIRFSISKIFLDKFIAFIKVDVT